MKKLFFIPVLFLVTSLYAQEAFVVPNMECAYKYQFMTSQANVMILAQINYAKACGKTVEEVASYNGELFAKTWNKEMGFNGLVKGMLHHSVCLTPSGTSEILEQSTEMIKIKLTNIFPALKKSGTVLDVTYDEYFRFIRILMSKISEKMGGEFTLQDTPEGMIWTIKKK